jgi:DNA ligase-1
MPAAPGPGPPSEPDANAPDAFLRFCEVAERVGATAKRLEKAAHLGAYFAGLGDDDLARAARFFAGNPFPMRDPRTTNVGGVALLTAIEGASGADPALLRARLVALGDPGDVAREAFAASPRAAGQAAPPLRLGDVDAFFGTLAASAGAKRKVEMVTQTLGRVTPLEAKYLVKLLAGDLRIGLREGAVEDAIARLAAVEVGRVQWVNMLTGDIGETALLARHGRLAAARMRLFHPVKFMLATAADDLTGVARQMPASFAVEDKFDGIRAQAHIAFPAPGEPPPHGAAAPNGCRVALFSRTLDEITPSFPDLVGPLGALAPAAPGGLLLDGEIVPVRGERVLPFQELQKRLGRKTLANAILAAVPVAFVAYDVLYADGRVLIDEPFAARRALLETLPVDGQVVRRAASEQHEGIAALDDAFAAARARGNEGLLVKDPRSPYKPGRRGRDWLKIKRALATLDVVVTAAQVGEGRRSRFLSDYTFAVRAGESDPTLLNVGKAYSGLTDAEVDELSEWFKAHTLQEFAHGKVRLVEPRIVLEVTFDRVQPSSRHKSGYALRFPRILRVRRDKPPGEIDTLDTVRRLGAMQDAPPHGHGAGGDEGA